jgi:thymidylate synthase
VDQLRTVVERLKTDPSSRRHVVTAWNPGELDATSLPACHALFQFFVAPGDSPMERSKLSVMMYQRSCDLFLGVPFNTAEYAVLLHLVAQVTGLVPHELVHVLADAHIYRDHQDAVREQLSREPYPSPRLALDPSLRSLDGVVDRYREIVARARAGEKPGPLLDAVARLEQYQFHPPIDAKMAV